MANVFVPLNRFQSVVTNLTGEQDEIYKTPTGVSSIVLSAQITNNSFVTQPVTILVTSNREVPVPSFEGVYSGSYLISASVGGFVTLDNQVIFTGAIIRELSYLTDRMKRRESNEHQGGDPKRVLYKTPEYECRIRDLIPLNMIFHRIDQYNKEVELCS